MSNSNDNPKPSKILLEECFAAQDDRFQTEIRKFQSASFLAPFAAKWLNDKRPWARQQIIAYLEGDLNLPGHEVVFKRIFHHFQQAHDHQMMGVLMVVLDRLVRRIRATRYHYDRRARRSWTTEVLYAKPNKSVIEQTDRWTEQEYGGRTHRYRLPDLRNRKGNLLFTQKTRNYLRRSAWRYFRYMSYREPETYVREMGRSLSRYEDRDFVLGENIIDNWSLMHACFFHHEAIGFTAAHTNLAPGRSLSELAPRPYQLQAWKTDAGAAALIDLLVNAKSSLVRLWSMELLGREHEAAIGKIELPLIVNMLGNPDSRVQQFAAELFEKHPALRGLTIDQWLDLLDSSSVNVLSLICNAMQTHVAEERLDNDQIIQWVCAQQVPVSSLGFELLQSRDEKKPLSTTELIRLADCRCATVADRLIEWAISKICERGHYNGDNLVDFFDSSLWKTRAAALRWLQHPDSPGYNDPTLWARLIETPFDDVKFRLIECLEQRQKHPRETGDEMTPLWVTVILGVHRGGRTKPKAVNQLANSIIQKTERGKSLIPVLAVALRSVRAPEMRTALSALVRLAIACPQLRPEIEEAIPELEFEPAEVAS